MNRGIITLSTRKWRLQFDYNLNIVLVLHEQRAYGQTISTRSFYETFKGLSRELFMRISSAHIMHVTFIMYTWLVIFTTKYL